MLLAAMLSGCNGNTHEPTPPKVMTLDSGWTFFATDTLAPMPAEVPGTVHTDLMNAGVIPDPFYDNNALGLGWVEQHDWEYRSSFELGDSALLYNAAELVLEGVDTYAKIWLNDVLLLSADNMFRSWRIDITPYLKSGNNTLRAVFESPVQKHRGVADSLGYRFPCDSDSSHTAPFVRKAAYHFGWDWAPRMVTSGFWKPVQIEFRNDARIARCDLSQLKVDEKRASLSAFVTVERYNNQDYTLEVGGVEQPILGDTATVFFELNNPQLWWPNGSGNPHLYPVEIRLLKNGVVVDSIHRKVGLRTVELVNKPDSIGTSFYFKINGEPTFMKGANWIPADVFLPRITPKKYRELLFAAKEANMNMLRVWGGGIYESDLFYDLCDSLGILVWQDFMFAGTTYPGDAAFLENVAAEAREQVQRLRQHACLALWCGNNEIEVAWNNWGWQQKYGYTPSDSTAMWHNYQHLFAEILPRIVAKESGGTQYVSTSPQSNWGTPENFNHGSMHYWGVWHGRELPDSYKNNVGRFMVEYGMQSYPAMETLEKYISKDELSLTSEVMVQRQKSYIGNGEIAKHIDAMNLHPQTFAEFVAASHSAQAHALDVATKVHLNSDGHCMGTLVWQLNDCWPGASWSLIDFEGSKKPAFYTVKDNFGAVN